MPKVSKTTGYYKIVKTVNNGKNELSVVPSGWEKNGILYWPSKTAGAAAMLSIEDPLSVPGKKGWSKHKCIVQRRNIKWDFETAEREVKKMLAESEMSASSSSENESTKRPQPKPMPKKRMKLKRRVEVSLTDVLNQPKKMNDKMLSQSPSHNQQPKMYIPQYNNEGYFVPNNIILTSQPAVNQSIGISLSNVMELLQTVSKNVDDLHKKLDTLNKKVDNLKKCVENSPNTHPREFILPSLKEINMNPIETVDELYEFEEKLKDKEFKKDLIGRLKHVCGANSMSGDRAAYTLVDKIFTRKLMTQMSWSGVSKQGVATKKPLQIFENVVRFFYTLVKIADPNYTELDAKNFFKKKVLPNSLRRNLSHFQRASMPKQRAFKIKNPSFSKNMNQFENSDSNGDNMITTTALETLNFANETNDCNDGSDGDCEMKSEEETEGEYAEEFLLGDDQIYAELIKADTNTEISPPHKRAKVK
ncbi:uncharacterized protein LOC129906193 isoform X2 [Episyrphus balteatus]|uniref:uncharacterized protein LOC129906193 isoform X2 n=1 Tax=Episyrphus balteatus TaxID=286459 RepID=UPI002486B565|nr:uncharacterized protein LOC129906193 isoform X2 [Episyrphus balteatus]